MRIVYVEDNRPDQSRIERIVRTGHHQVFPYSTAEDALHNLSRDQPDMLLVDVELAGPMNGLDMVRHLRANDYHQLIVAITAVATEQECMDAGCDAYFVKPVAVGRLWELIEHYSTTM
jgi:DNA-binding response OmpR family regulator